MDKPTAAARVRAKRARSAPTLAEKTLWLMLRDRGLASLKFRRQAPIGPWIADFASFAARLVVEIDGGVHRLHAERDAERDKDLSCRGFRVLRFTNEQVLGRPNEVLSAIARACAD